MVIGFTSVVGDLFHAGHIRMIEECKEHCDYLIVGVTNDSFDRDRGKLNVRNNVLERVEAEGQSHVASEFYRHV